MGSGVSRTIADSHVGGRARSQSRHKVKMLQLKYESDFKMYLMENYDSSMKGSLDTNQAKDVSEKLMKGMNLDVPDLTDADVDQVMRMGGAIYTPEVTYDEIPQALSIVLALRPESSRIHSLFTKYEDGESGKLGKSMLMPLLGELNDGILPTSEDMEYIDKRFHVSSDEDVDEAQLKAAIEGWYCLASDSSHPDNPEDARKAGYTDEQIAMFEAMEIEQIRAEAKVEIATFTLENVDTLPAEKKVADEKVETAADSQVAESKPATTEPATQSKEATAESPEAKEAPSASPEAESTPATESEPPTVTEDPVVPETPVEAPVTEAPVTSEEAPAATQCSEKQESSVDTAVPAQGEIQPEIAG